METSSVEDHHQKLDGFPCAFNMASSEKVSRSRLKATKNIILAELKFKDDYESELIRKNNLLTWIWFGLDKRDEAERLCKEVVAQTKSKNVASLGNLSYIYFFTGNEIEAEKCIKSLQELKNMKDFHNLQTEAKAEQAYYHSRLGGPENVILAIQLFSEAVAEIPDNLMWRFGLGLLCRRATNMNIFCSSREIIDMNKCREMAIENLMEVADKGDNRVKGMAFAQLVSLRQNYAPGCSPGIDVLFRHLGVRELCDKALADGCSGPSVLTHCGKALKEIDIDKSIRLLEKSVKDKSSSTAFHFLGLSYKFKAHLLAQSTMACQSTHSNNTNIESCDDHAATSAPTKLPEYKTTEFTDTSMGTQLSNDVNTENELVKKAIECFKTAVTLGEGSNFPALLDLGLLLKESGEDEAALTHFNKVTNSLVSLTGHKLTVIQALEQAGLCYLKLGEAEGCRSTHDYQDLGKKKLTKAISLAADLVLTMPELKECDEELLAAFRILENEIDKEPRSIHQHKEKIKLLELLQNYGQIIEVVQRIRLCSEEDLMDEHIITATFQSYLKLDQPENALAFHNCIAVRVSLGDFPWWQSTPVHHLKVKVFLEAIFTVLKDRNENPYFLFQQLFKMCYGPCVSRGSGLNDGPGNTTKVVRDVLVVFDDDEGPGVTIKLARCVKTVATFVFGLTTEENLQVC